MLSLTTLILLSILPISQANTITSCGDGNTCDCNDNEHCTVNCIGDHSCAYTRINVNAASSITFSCNGYQACIYATINGPTTNIPFVINCTGGNNACWFANINAGNAASFDLYCDGDDTLIQSCSYANINCGSETVHISTGICIIHCIAQSACYSADIDCGSASECQLLCDSGWNQTCWYLNQLNCRNSVCSMQCGDNTATDACTANTPPITTNAISFICNGAECDPLYVNALEGFTPNPSTAPSNHPTPATRDPTSDPTTNLSSAHTMNKLQYFVFFLLFYIVFVS